MSIGNYPAFPCEAQGDRSVPHDHDYIQTGIYSGKFPGLMIRDWFAGQAATKAIALAMEFGREGSPMPLAANLAYEFADAMLAERNKAGPEKAMQHVAYYDEGQFHWMSGIAPRDCELFAARAAIAAATGEAK